MKKVIIFAIVTMTAVLMLTAASFGQRRIGSYGGNQARAASPVWNRQPMRREFPPVSRGGFQGDYSRRLGQIRRERDERDFRRASLIRQREAMWRLSNSRYGFESRRELHRIERAREERRERMFTYGRIRRY